MLETSGVGPWAVFAGFSPNRLYCAVVRYTQGRN